MRAINIGDRKLGLDQPTYVVAEISANHNHSMDRAVELVRAAGRAGADAIKLQTYTAETLTIDCDREWFQIGAGSLWAGRTLYRLYGEAYTPWEWHPRLFEVAHEAGLDCFSTPFDDSAVDFLEGLNSPVHKIASFELVDLPLLKKIARTCKPVIASTGMASLAEIEEAVRTLRNNGTDQLVLLKCTSAYPALPEEMNLRTIPHLAQTFDVLSGLSDHTLGSSVAVAAVALGARVIEKHFTLRREDGGPDSAFSMEPDEFARMVHEIRQVEKALGCVSYEATPYEQRNRAFRRSLFAVENIKAGERFSHENVRVIRPGQGLHPRYLEVVLSKTATAAISRGTPLSWELIGT